MVDENKNEFLIYQDTTRVIDEEQRENSNSQIEMISDEEYMLECARYGEYDDLIKLLNEIQLDLNYQDTNGNSSLRTYKLILYLQIWLVLMVI